jgi:hypothetical protein
MDQNEGMGSPKGGLGEAKQGLKIGALLLGREGATAGTIALTQEGQLAQR